MCEFVLLRCLEGIGIMGRELDLFVLDVLLGLVGYLNLAGASAGEGGGLHLLLAHLDYDIVSGKVWRREASAARSIFSPHPVQVGAGIYTWACFSSS